MFKSLLEDHDTLVFFDVETTGLDAANEQIIELAAIAIGRDGTRKEMDRFVSLHTRTELPEKITELTGITTQQLANEGISEESVVKEFLALFGEKTLLIAYNAQFDIDFITHAIKRSGVDSTRFDAADYLDPLSVCKDRKPYPHKLSDAIEFYEVEAENTHRAIDDVDALVKVTEAEIKERNDVYKYINVFGYNPKYGLPKRKFKGVRYLPQPYGKPKLPYEILPYTKAV